MLRELFPSSRINARSFTAIEDMCSSTIFWIFSPDSKIQIRDDNDNDENGRAPDRKISTRPAEPFKHFQIKTSNKYKTIERG